MPNHSTPLPRRKPDQYTERDWDERFNTGRLNHDPEDFFYENPVHRGSPDGKDYLRESQENHPHRDSFYAGRGPKNFQRSDERIKDEVCESLTHHPEVDADAIEVEVQSGEVTLSGTVSSRHMKYMAEDCAERCMGVKEIHNHIRVKKEEHAVDIKSDRSTFLV